MQERIKKDRIEERKNRTETVLVPLASLSSTFKMTESKRKLPYIIETLLQRLLVSV